MEGENLNLYSGIEEEEFDKKREAFLSDEAKMAHIKAVFDLSVVKKPVGAIQTNTDKSLKDLVDDQKNIIDEGLVKAIEKENGKLVDGNYLKQLDMSMERTNKMNQVSDLINKFGRRVKELDDKIQPLKDQKSEYEEGIGFLRDYYTKLAGV